MPQAELMTNEILILIGIPIGLFFSDLSSDGGVDVSEDDYIDLFLEFAHQTDQLCFLLDTLLQKLFAVIIGYTFLNKLSTQSEYFFLSLVNSKNDFTWLSPIFDSNFEFYYIEYIDAFWDDSNHIIYNQN